VVTGPVDPEFGAGRTRHGEAKRLPVFYYDLGSVECYLAGEQVNTALGVVPEWEPVLASELGAEPSEPDLEATTRRIEALGLQPLRWPSRWPPDTRLAMLTATFAKRGGRAVAFSLAAFRQAFAGGRDLSEESTVLIAAAACEMHPKAVLKALELRSTAAALAAANERARADGVRQLPALVLDGERFDGPGGLEAAIAATGGRT
jgi:2-hydroxychromene-2-carboxylate isomerase